MAISLNRFTFQDAVTSTGNGQELRINNGLSLTLSLSGTASARTVTFEGKGETGDFVPVKGYNLETSDLATQSSGITDEIWVFDVVGIDYFRVKVDSISGGNLSAKGKLVG